MTICSRIACGAVAVALLAQPSVVAAQDAAGLSGLYDVAITSPIGVSPAKLVLLDLGGTLVGTMRGEGGPTTIDGTRGADGVMLRYSVTYENAPLPITLKAAAPAADAKLSGSADFGGLAEGSWTATKVTPSGVDGVWAFTANDGAADIPGHLALLDDNGTVSGRLLVPSRGISGVIKGSHSGADLKLSADAIADDGTPVVISLPATVSGQSLSGTYAVADRAGRWTAKRP